MDDSALIDRYRALETEREQRQAAVHRQEAKEDNYAERLNAFKEKLSNAGIDPTKLDQQIAALETEIDQQLTELERNLSGEQQSQEAAPTEADATAAPA